MNSPWHCWVNVNSKQFEWGDPKVWHFTSRPAWWLWLHTKSKGLQDTNLDSVWRVGQNKSILWQLVAGDNPPMCQNLLQTDALMRVNVQHPRHQILGRRRHHVPVATTQCKLTLTDTCQDLLRWVLGTVGEWRLTAHDTESTELSSPHTATRQNRTQSVGLQRPFSAYIWLYPRWKVGGGQLSLPSEGRPVVY